jgi:hypothetical protein
MLTFRHPRRCLALVLPFACASCFTMGLWGLEPEDDVDPATGRVDTVFALDDEARWGWEEIGWRVALTPFSVALDVLTCPVQCWLWADDDDCSCDR